MVSCWVDLITIPWSGWIQGRPENVVWGVLQYLENGTGVDSVVFRDCGCRGFCGV